MALHRLGGRTWVSHKSAKRMLERPDEKIGRLFQGVVEIPSLPSVVEKLLAIPVNEETERQFVDVIAVDPGLVAKVLRLVNNAFYSLRAPIGSLPQAAHILGRRTLKSLALSAAIGDVFRGGFQDLDPTRLWRHSVAVGTAARCLGEACFTDAADDLYVAGFLHDLGIFLLAEHLPDDYRLVMRLMEHGGKSLSEVEVEVFGMSHAELSYTLAQRWKLPPVLGECIRLHETPYSGVAADGDESQQWIDVVRYAHRWAIHNGLGFVGTASEPLEEPDWFAATEIDPKAILGDETLKWVDSHVAIFESEGNGVGA